MSAHTITIAGFIIPTNDPLFLSVLFVHVVAGYVCVVSGAVALLSDIAHGAYRVRLHIAAMGTSFVLLLIGFYVGNARFLPVWRSLPPVTYWVIPALIGMPLVARAYWQHALARAERLAIRAD